MTQQFKAMKIRIKDEQHYHLVQEALFAMGREEKESLERNVADMQKQPEEMKRKLEKMF